MGTCEVGRSLSYQARFVASAAPLSSLTTQECVRPFMSPHMFGTWPRVKAKTLLLTTFYRVEKRDYSPCSRSVMEQSSSPVTQCQQAQKQGALLYSPLFFDTLIAAIDSSEGLSSVGGTERDEGETSGVLDRLREAGESGAGAWT